MCYIPTSQLLDYKFRLRTRDSIAVFEFRLINNMILSGNNLGLKIFCDKNANKFSRYIYRKSASAVYCVDRC
jgi:hypothetical protein